MIQKNHSGSFVEKRQLGEQKQKQVTGEETVGIFQVRGGSGFDHRSDGNHGQGWLDSVGTSQMS